MVLSILLLTTRPVFCWRREAFAVATACSVVLGLATRGARGAFATVSAFAVAFVVLVSAALVSAALVSAALVSAALARVVRVVLGVSGVDALDLPLPPVGFAELICYSFSAVSLVSSPAAAMPRACCSSPR